MPLANDKDYIYTVVSKELKETLKAQADQQGRSLSNYVSYLLEQMQEQECLGKLTKEAKYQLSQKA